MMNDKQIKRYHICPECAYFTACGEDYSSPVAVLTCPRFKKSALAGKEEKDSASADKQDGSE